MATSERPEVEVADRAALRAWFAEHHATSDGIWLVRPAKGSPGYLAYREVVEEALCVGWIDSLPRRLETGRSVLLVTPRKPRSNWSAVNKALVERLTAEGLMLPAGLAVVDAAKASGTWNALDAVEELAEPEDLARVLDADPAARDHWDAFPRSARRAILEWLQSAKTPATREKRVTEIVGEAREGRRANQWRQPRSATPRRA